MKSSNRDIIIGGAAVFVFLVATLALVGWYWDMMWLTMWVGTQEMAVPTAFCFIACAVALWTVARCCHFHESGGGCNVCHPPKPKSGKGK